LNKGEYRKILGIDFFSGSAREAVDRMENGGLLVVPAAPALKDLARNPSYRQALEESDLCIADSSLMVMLWNLMEHDSIQKLSGLAYLRELLRRDSFHARPEDTFWVMASKRSAQRNVQWLLEQGIAVPPQNVYIAPIYGKVMHDPDLVETVQRLKPRHIIMTIGGGTQERAGLYLKKNLNYAPAIHCIGAAISFLSGDQVLIPIWADRLGLGWLLRCVSAPRSYVPRYWEARKLIPLMHRYRSQMPILEARS
jgi:UDP-N-acetyl-D-mannosaminuronic acid transferase (WecB/TagA/CpsF family)